MKLFLKHLLCSTKRKPLQPILFALTMLLAVTSAVFTFSLGRAMEQESAYAQQKTYGSAHIAVTLDDSSASRFMFVRDAERILGKNAEVAGSLDLPMAMGESKAAVSGVAVDFSQIERIFTFDFTDYGVLTPSAVAKSAFVTQRFAQAHKLAVGSLFEVSVMGQTRTYTVVGISAVPLIGSNDVVVDISGVVRLIAGDSLLLSAMKDGFRPCNTIYIEVLEGTAEDCVARLSADSVFSQNAITVVSGEIEAKTHTKALSAILDVAVVLTCILSAAVAFCCLYILSCERMVENRGFIYSGARAKDMHLMQGAEVLAYWIFGSVFGTLFAALLMRIFLSSAGFCYVTTALRAWDVIKGMLLILGVTALTVLAFIYQDRLRRYARPIKPSLWLFFLPLALTALAMLLTLVLPIRARFALYIPFVFLFAISLFLYAAPLLRELAQRCNTYLETKLQTTRRVSSNSLYYAIKNVLSVKPLQNTARLVALLAFVVFSVGAVVMGAAGHIRAAENAFPTEYVVLGATENCYQKVKECTTVDEVHRLYMQTGKDEADEPVILLASDGQEALSEHFRPDEMPKGNRAAISLGEARARSLRVGDTFMVTVSGRTLSLEVGEILDVSVVCVIFDASHFGLHYNMLAVDGIENLPAGALWDELSAKTVSEMATLMHTEELWQQRLSTLEVYVSSGAILLSVIAILALIGTVNNLWQCYRSRKEEFRLYHYSGMTGAQVENMKWMEAAIVVLFGLILAFLASLLFLCVTNVALRSRAFETFLSIGHYFKIK